MSRRFSELSPDERRLFETLAADPLTDVAPQLADAALDSERPGRHERSELLKAKAAARLPLQELLRGRALPDGECDRVAARIASLLNDPATTEQPGAEALAERELSAALGRPQRDGMLALLDAEGGIDEERLREQYEFQTALLASLDLLEEKDGQPGITGIDRRFHDLPSYEDILKRLQTPEMRRKVEQGFTQLLLVPFALPLRQLIEAWGRCLRRNEHLLPQVGGDPAAPRLDREQPVRMWEEEYGLRNGLGPDEDGRIVSFPQRFTTDHGGRTKAQLLADDPTAGWQVLLTEPFANLPRRGQVLAGRQQIECGREPRQYLASHLAGEEGLTIEAYPLLVAAALERTGTLPDTQTFSFLTASYLPSSGFVPDAYWDSGLRQANLDRYPPDFEGPRGGARAAVRVL